MSRTKYASKKILDNYYKELGTILTIDGLKIPKSSSMLMKFGLVQKIHP